MSWERRAPSSHVLALTGLLRRSLDRAALTLDTAAWLPRAGSPAALAAADPCQSVAADRCWSPVGRRSLDELLSRSLSHLLLAASGYVDALAATLEANALVPGTSAAARGTVEHAAAVHWLLHPAVTPRRRLARVLLLEEDGLELDLRASNVPLPERQAQLTRLHRAAWTLFGGDDPDTAGPGNRAASLQSTVDGLALDRRPVRLLDNTTAVDDAGAKVMLPRITSLAGERYPGLHELVLEHYRLLGQPLSPYAWLSSRTHPCTKVLHRSRVVGSDGRVHAAVEPQELRLAVFLAAHALAVATTTVARWYGSPVDLLSEWEDDIDALTPGLLRPAS